VRAAAPAEVAQETRAAERSEAVADALDAAQDDRS
jgi:hypothetical protein